MNFNYKTHGYAGVYINNDVKGCKYVGLSGNTPKRLNRHVYEKHTYYGHTYSRYNPDKDTITFIPMPGSTWAERGAVEEELIRMLRPRQNKRSYTLSWYNKKHRK